MRNGKATIWQPKIFEVDVRFGVQLSSGLDEFIYKVVIFLASGTRFSETEIEFIFQKLLVICSAIQNDRKGSVGVDACAERSEDKLSD